MTRLPVSLSMVKRRKRCSWVSWKLLFRRRNYFTSIYNL